MAADRPLPAPADDCRRHWQHHQLPRRMGQLLPGRRHRRRIVVAQTLLFLLAFVFAPKHGLLASRRRAREAHP
ncbi:hypothetical protein ACVXG7_08765 [Enterobacter hormaechei]